MLYVSMQMSINKRKPFKGYNGNKTKWRKKKQTSLLLKIKVLKKKRHEKFLKSCFVCFFLFYSFFFRWLKVVESSKEMIVQFVVNYLSFLFPSICEELKKWGWNEESCWKQGGVGIRGKWKDERGKWEGDCSLIIIGGRRSIDVRLLAVGQSTSVCWPSVVGGCRRRNFLLIYCKWQFLKTSKIN